MTKRKRKAARKAPKVRKIVVPPDVVVKVVTPPGTQPVVMTDKATRTVEIVPVPKHKSWWQTFFGS